MKFPDCCRLLPSLVLVAFCVVPSGCGSANEGESPSTSILWITVDTLRSDHMGSYGYFRNTTPRIDALAAKSFLFEDCVVPMATTLPSHISMLTGTLPLEHGVLANVSHGGKRFVRSEELVSFTEVLRDAGYATAGFISARPLQSWTGVDVGFDHYNGPEEKERRGEKTVDLAIHWMREQRAQEPDRPVFLWVHLFDPHAPFRPADGYAGKFRSGPKLDAHIAEREFELVTVAHGGAVVRTAESINNYDAEILYTDAQVGRLLDALKEEELETQTVVMFNTDHGEGIGQHGVARHGLIWNEQVQSAFILHVPGQSARRIATPVSSIDSFPTLLGQVEILGSELFLEQCTGSDALHGGYSGSLQWSQSSARLLTYGQEVVYSIHREKWKYLWLGEEDEALYDLDGDPHELKDVAGEHRELCEDLRSALLAERAKQEQRGLLFGAGAVEDIDADTLQDLRDLGYTGMDPLEESTED
ncbi:MAG: arylsulfatase A-like enzyme [Planctomycetota bacterium]|jgi:arylsulfatase A-like enzyme